MANNILIVTSYPEKGSVHSERTVGVASYTKQLLQGLVKVSNDVNVVVLAERFVEPSSYTEDGMKINRMWQRGNFFDILKLWYYLAQSKDKIVLLSFEGYMFGNLFLSFVALWLFSLLRFFDKKTVVMMHQIPKELSFAKVVQKNVVKLGISFMKVVLSRMSKVVVFEEALRDRVGNNSTFIPHFVPEVSPVAQTRARKELGLLENIQIILYFGYIAPYKGLERLIELWPVKSKSQLIIAGGINPNHKGRAETEKYVDRIMQAAKDKDILTTGFVLEEKIGLYFSACDAVVLPYTEFMSSSGPMSLGWAYGKPVIVAESLKDYVKSEDVAGGMMDVELDQSNVFYKNNEQDFNRLINNLSQQKIKLEKWAKYMHVSRSLAFVSSKMANILWGITQ